MARPTNRERALRLLRTFGHYVKTGSAVGEPGVAEGFQAISLNEMRTALGPGSDTAILDLIAVGDVWITPLWPGDEEREASNVQFDRDLADCLHVCRWEV
jgi:hypothetical protein